MSIKYPDAIREGARHLRETGEDAVVEYYRTGLTDKRRRGIDLWILRTCHPILQEACGNSEARFIRLVREFAATRGNGRTSDV